MTLALSNHALRSSGGMERYAMTLVRGLHARGVRPVFIAKSFDASLDEYRWVDPVAASMFGVPAKLRDICFDWRIGRIKRRLGLCPLLACNTTRWSDIAVCGGNHPGYLEAMGSAVRRSDGWKIALERAHFENAAHIVAHSALMKNEIVRHYGIDPAKITLLYPPVDAERFKPAAADERDALRKHARLSPTIAPSSCSPRPGTSERGSICSSPSSPAPSCRPPWSSPAGRCKRRIATCATSAIAATSRTSTAPSTSP